ncbi:uncharacterized protein HMPREF1541_09544 [Cyphellophora europaea CBS 101466]|uniref:Uncharacterized protein n=1 Tax=Cyphellophora europaea (strain CBS 101466) TaxID=1220924 RepID=W2SAF2_CYPE1|nr:uncharacterized protein HMPREF1541_09544 [Cyphellophora europaea CBS 101466]ETN45711.1 hypothetical protein HMPREF1541_09544 [Cyphellophora europaea CBS 101466]
MSFTLAVTALGLSAVAGALPHARTQKTIEWNSCPELNENITLQVGNIPILPFECGSLTVPLDYTEPDSDPLDLAVFRVKATKEPVLGSVMFNPGGPGGTGGLDFNSAATDLRANVGEQWDLVSWDPRGTGNTIPFNCPLEGLDGSAPAAKRDVGTLASGNLTEGFLNGGWEYAGAIADSCFSTANETGELIGTVFAVRDMMNIVDALCEDGLLRYYGWSYGTALGSYAAALFPDRVERMVLDGNIDPVAYQSGTWGDWVDDIDEVFWTFLESCFDNKEECALAQFVNANSTQDMLDVINLALEPLAENATTSIEAYVNLITVKSPLIRPLYFPAQWPAFAEAIVALLNPTEAPEEPAADATPAVEPYDQAVNALLGIRGSDAIFRPETAEEYLPTVEYQANVSKSFSDVQYISIWASARWKMDAKERYFGDFNKTTKTPILYVNGNYDPVTPISDARSASAGFKGSVVLEHNGLGHGIFADPSTCVQKHVQQYFLDGTLPDPDTVCEPDLGPWELAAARNGSILGALELTSS